MIKSYNIPPVIRETTFPGVQFGVLVNAFPLDLTGATIKMSVKRLASDTTAIQTFSTEDGSLEIATDPTTGIFYLMPQLITLPVFEYYYDIKFFFNNDTEKTYISGRWKILQNVTV